MVTVLDSAGRQISAPTHRVKQGRAGPCIEEGSEDTANGARAPVVRRGVPGGFSPSISPFLPVRSLARELSPSRRPSPRPQPLALSGCSWVPRGPPTSEFTQPRRQPSECCPPCHSISCFRPPPPATFASCGFHSDTAGGGGRGRGAEAPFWLVDGQAPSSSPRFDLLFAPLVGTAS